MSEKALYRLRIDKGFRDLICPLSRNEYPQLEANLLSDGCRDPIVVWQGRNVIMDGHNRYELCTKHRIPFAILEMEFFDREDAIAWICSNQLGRRNISEETRKFLIGKQYEAEKLSAAHRNVTGINQHSGKDGSPDITIVAKPSSTMHGAHTTANRIAQENHLSHATVQKYAQFARAVEVIGEREPELATKLLSGNYKMSHENVIALSQLGAAELRAFNDRISSKEQASEYKAMRGELEKAAGLTRKQEPSVKDMPSYDPDSEVVGLSLTIPSWASSIDRVKSKTDFRSISDHARQELVSALHDLREKTMDTLASIEEDSNE